MSALSLALARKPSGPSPGSGPSHLYTIPSERMRRYSNLRGTGDDSSEESAASASPAALPHMDIPRTTTDTLDATAFSPLVGPTSQLYHLSNNRQASPATSLGSQGIRSPLQRPVSPGLTAAAQVLVQSQHNLLQDSGASPSRAHLIPRVHKASSRRRLSSTSHTPNGSYVRSRPSTPNMGQASAQTSGQALSVPSAPLSGSPLSESVSVPTAAAASNGPINTNSPVAIAAASSVTPDRLSRLLLTQGPLAIRHITSHLALTIQGFADLSLSKQRRLIIAALDAGDPVNSVVFEKVGWGRWAARKTDSPAQAAESQQQQQHRRGSITAELMSASVLPPQSPVLAAVDGRGLHYGVKPESGAVAGAWADDVDLADDDMMFHNSRPVGPSHFLEAKSKSPQRPRRRSERMRQQIMFKSDDYDENVFDDDDDEDEDALDLDDEEEMTDDAMRPHARSGGGDTDDEDWRGMGAATLRRPSTLRDTRESDALDALVQLQSV